jgi:hypothetical protein
VIHRHVQYPSDTPAEELPSAAIIDTLERGDLDAWRPIAVSIARDPFGPLARRVERLLDAFPIYGASPLWRCWIDRCRARAEGRRRSGSPLTLSRLRRSMGLTQLQLAGRLAMSQSDVSKLELRSDVRLSTLRRYVEALGGRLRIVFETDRAWIDLGTSRPTDGSRRG